MALTELAVVSAGLATVVPIAAAALCDGAPVAVAAEHAAVHALEKAERSETAQLLRKQGPPARAIPACVVGSHWHGRSAAAHPFKDTAFE